MCIRDRGNADYWIVRTNSSGTILWQNVIGGSLYDFLTCSQQTTDGGFILGGYSSSGISGDKTESNMGEYDYWIIKTDASGNISWQNSIKTNKNDMSVSYTHLRAHETVLDIVCRLLLEKTKTNKT
mgnify:CR=1 FL=1